MRRFRYIEPGYNDDPVTITVSEEYIIKMYLPYWWKQVIKSGRQPDRFAVSDAIDDFCTANGAEEI